LLLSLVFLLLSIALISLFIVLFFRSRKKLLSEALTDSLLSIKNRRYINTTLPEIVSEHRKNTLPLSVIMVDVDHFKQFNDCYGHQEGDRALIEISAAINSLLRKTDTVCRYGGEELLVILTNCGTEAAEHVAGRIKEAVMNLVIKHDRSAAANVLTVSQGVFSAVPGKKDSSTDFIRQADKNLYEAKKGGRNRYVAADGMSCSA